MPVLHKIETDFDALRKADKDVATLRFTRGMHIFLSKPENDEEWKSDLKSALDSAENAMPIIGWRECDTLHTVTSTLAEIFRDPVLDTQNKCLRQELSGYSAKHQDGFRQVFSTAEIVTITDPELAFSKWKDVKVYKHSTSSQVAQVAAHTLVPVVPVLSATATILKLGKVRPKKAGIRSFDTVPLVEKETDEDQEKVPNLYDLRFMLLDLVHCKSTHLYPLGDVSFRETLEGTTVTGSMQRTLPVSEYALSDNHSTKLLEPKA